MGDNDTDCTQAPTRYAFAAAEHNVVLRVLHFVQGIELGIRVQGRVTRLVRHRLDGGVVQIAGALMLHRLQLRRRRRR